MNHALPLLVGIPLGMAVLTLMLSKASARIADFTAFLTVAATTFIAFMLMGSPVDTYWMGNWFPPFGIVLVYDGLSGLMLLIINLIALLSIIYSFSYMEKYTAKPKFYSLFLLMLAGMNGVALTGDLFNMFVFLEMASLASYALVGFGVEHQELEASFKYLILGTVASTMILLGIALTYAMTGSVNMADVASTLSAMPAKTTIAFAAGVFLMGFSLKSGLVPFHAWLPDAHPSAPAPISAMLSGVLIKALGVYAMVRVMFNVLGAVPIYLDIMLVLGGISMVVGVLLAVGQYDLKRQFAYHSVSQLGYIVLALGLGTNLGMIAGIFHLINHSLFKSLLFLTSGAFEHATGTKSMKKLGGMGELMPVTSTSMVIGSVSISGIPPFNGFFSKLLIIIACIASGHVFLGVLASIASVLTLLSFTKAMRFSVFGKIPENLANTKEVPFSMAFSMIFLAVICLGVGIAYLIGGPTFTDIFLQPAADVLMDGLENGSASYITTVLGIGG
ncbi:MAG: complex I subunit 5 family protein [bacterium]